MGLLIDSNGLPVGYELFSGNTLVLEVRPIFHWKPERIHGHFVVCFLAFMLERKLEMMLNEEVFIKTKNAPLASQIFKLLKMNLPHNLNNKEQISEILKINKTLSWGQISLF